jgi:CSLREA domain-containing protein
MNTVREQQRAWFRLLTALALLLTTFANVRPAYALGSTYTVNTLADNTTNDVYCSLREALAAANNSPFNANCGAGSSGDDLINFNLVGIIYLSSTLNVLAGQGSLTLNGGGITLSGDTDNNGTGNTNVMVVEPGAVLVMDNVSIIKGYSSSNSYGAGLTIQSGASATITNSLFQSNSNIGGGAGGIQNSGTLNVFTTYFHNNTSVDTIGIIPFSMGGGLFNVTGGNAIVDTSTFDSNSAGTWGGGIMNTSGATLTLNNSYFSFNSAASGGGIFNAGTATLTQVTLDNNTATNGGGMFNYQSSPTLTDCTILWNFATNGTGMYNEQASPILTNVTFRENAATGSGGGMANTSSSNPTLVNVTFSGNTASFNGGGMFNSSSAPNLTAVTFSLNTANNFGGGIYNTSSNLTVLRNTIIANSTNGDCYGAINTAQSHHNLIEDAGPFYSCGLTHAVNNNIVGQGDPKLGILQDNGGLTDTIKPLASSPVINAGDSAGACPSTDQVGKIRPQGSACDIGAFEYAPTFLDVPMSYWSWQFIERLASAGVTGGCGGGNYCPEVNVNRAQMAVFLLRGEHGSAYNPPAATGTVFADVSSSYWAAAWIEQLAAEGITGGCGSGNYCPETPVTRDQMAVFLLRAKYGPAYAPPAATGVFTDVPTTHWAASWIEQLASEGITGGCGAGIYCPATVVNRAQMAVFLVRTFNLP